MGFEGGFPGSGRCGEVGGCGGHGVEEAAETVVGSYGCCNCRVYGFGVESKGAIDGYCCCCWCP